MQMGIDRFLRNCGKWAGPALGLLAFVVYLVTLSPFAYPGESTKLIVSHAGLDQFPPMANFLWGYLVKVVALIPLGTLALRLNFLSAIFGGLCVWMMFVLTSMVPHNRTAEENESRFPMEPVQNLSGLVAALYLAFCMPFWVVSTRAHTLSFDVFLLMAATLLLVRYYKTKRVSDALIFALLYGLGTTEYSTFVLLTPVTALCLAIFMWRSGQLRFRPVAGVILCYLAGLGIYFVAALQYRLSPAFEWRDFQDYYQILWFIWREQYREVRFSLPHVGWLLVFMVSVLPWIIVIASPKRAMTRSAVMGSNFLHGLLSVLAILVMFNIPIAPWPLLRFRGLLVMPYVLIAMWAGYLAGYWYIFFYQQSRFEANSRARIRVIGRTVFVPALGIVMLIAALFNARWASGRSSAITHKMVQQIINDIGDHQWLLSNGLMDDLLTLEAHEQGIPLHILDAAQSTSRPYLRRVVGLFDDLRLKGLAELGLAPLLAEWLSTDPNVTQQLAVLSASDLWFGQGYQPLSDKMIVLGVKNPSDIDLDAYFADQKSFWEGLGLDLVAAVNPKELNHQYTRWGQGHVSMLANNAGVMLEDLGRTDLAFEAYMAARQIDSNNVSALLNVLSLSTREARPGLLELEAEFEALARRMRSRLRLWSLAKHYGYVRAPEALSSRGWAWAMSGKPGIAVAEMQRAMAAGANKQKAELAMASFYLMQDKESESAEIYTAVLEESPNHLQAILGMLHIAMREGNFVVAVAYLDRLKELGAPEGLIRLEEATLEALDGNEEVAEEILLQLVDDQPKNIRAWALLALVSSDDEVVDQATQLLTSAAVTSPQILLSLSQVALGRRDLVAAREHLEKMLKMQPQNQAALERILRIDVQESKRDSAEEHIERLLSLDPKNAYANYLLGTLQYARGDLELAENSYQVSLQSRRSFAALNDLAWILQIKGRYNEGLAFAREALALDEQSGSAWDTLGVLYLGLGQLDMAKSALEKALALQPGNPSVILHVAQLYESMGMKEEALKLADSLLARPSEMSPDSYDELRKLMQRLRSGG